MTKLKTVAILLEAHTDMSIEDVEAVMRESLRWDEGETGHGFFELNQVHAQQVQPYKASRVKTKK